MKIKAGHSYLLAASFVICCFFAFKASTVQAYTGPFNFTAASSSTSSTYDPASANPPTPHPPTSEVDIYNATPAGGQDMSDAVANSAIYLGSGVSCSSGGPTSTKSASGWVHFTFLNTPNPITDVPAGQYSKVTISADPTGLADGKYCAQLDFARTSGGQPSPNPKISIVLDVGAGAPSTDCQINLTASPMSVSSGSSSTLNWTSSNCSAPLTLNGGKFSNASEATFNSASTGPLAATTTYTISGRGQSGVLGTSQVTVSVTGGGGCAFVNPFTASPNNITSGSSTSLTFSTVNCNHAVISGGTWSNTDISSLLPNAFLNTGALNTSTTFFLTISGPIGSPVNAQVDVTVGAACNSSSVSFTTQGGASSETVAQFAYPVSLIWSIAGTCSNATLTASGVNDVGLNQGYGTGSSSFIIGTDNNGTTVYTMTVQPGNIQETVTVTVGLTCTVGNINLKANGSTGSVTVNQGTAVGITWNVPSPSCTSAQLTASGVNDSGLNIVAPVPTGGFAASSANVGSTTYTLTVQPGNVQKTVTVIVTASCLAGNITFTADGQPGESVTQGSAVNLAWVIPASCASGTLKASGVNDVGLNIAANPPSGNRAASTSNLGATTYTLTVQPGSISKTVTVTVTVPMNCTVVVKSFNNGVAGLPSGGFSYTILFPATGYSINGSLTASNSRTYTSQPAGDVYTAANPTGYGGTSNFVNITIASSQTCAANGTVTFQYNFNDVAPCTINLNATPSNINAGSASSISWTTSNCTSGTLSGGIFGGGTSETAQISAGSASTGIINTTTTYTFSASGPAGTGTPKQVTVTVTSPPQPPCSPTDPSGCGPGGNCSGSGCNPPSAQNTSLNAGVACGNILLSWTVPTGAVSFNLYRNTTSSLPGIAWKTGITGTSYTDSAPLASAAYYWIQSVNGAGTSSATVSSNVPISPTTCQVTLGSSQKLISAVNGKAQPYSSTCIGNQAGSTSTINNGDTITFIIAVCNNGTIDATGVSVSDDLTNSNLSNLRNVIITGGGSSSTAGQVTTFNLGTIPAGQKKTATYDVTVNAPSGGTQTLYRFHNVAAVTYDSSGGTTTSGCNGTYAHTSSPCSLDNGFHVFNNGAKSPTEQEVSP